MSSNPGKHQGLGDIAVIVPAAGKGTRMAADDPKQYLTLRDKPLLAHTLARLVALHPARVILVVSAGDEQYKSVAETQCCEIVIGGETRAESVMNGLEYLSSGTDDWVMVHDAARPCVRSEDIERLVQGVKDSDVGGLLAVPITDTVKSVEGGVVSTTLSREELFRAQTPQLFRYGVLAKAMKAARSAGIAITDEASAIERIGLAPLVVAGSADNIKVTLQSDLPLAEFYLAQQEGSAPA